METKQVIALTCSRLERKPGNAMMNTKSLKWPEESWRNAGDYPLHFILKEEKQNQQSLVVRLTF